MKADIRSRPVGNVAELFDGRVELLERRGPLLGGGDELLGLLVDLRGLGLELLLSRVGVLGEGGEVAQGGGGELLDGSREFSAGVVWGR